MPNILENVNANRKTIPHHNSIVNTPIEFMAALISVLVHAANTAVRATANNIKHKYKNSFLHFFFISFHLFFCCFIYFLNSFLNLGEYFNKI